MSPRLTPDSKTWPWFPSQVCFLKVLRRTDLLWKRFNWVEMHCFLKRFKSGPALRNGEGEGKGRGELIPKLTSSSIFGTTKTTFAQPTRTEVCYCNAEFYFRTFWLCAWYRPFLNPPTVFGIKTFVHRPFHVATSARPPALPPNYRCRISCQTVRGNRLTVHYYTTDLMNCYWEKWTPPNSWVMQLGDRIFQPIASFQSKGFPITLSSIVAWHLLLQKTRVLLIGVCEDRLVWCG